MGTAFPSYDELTPMPLSTIPLEEDEKVVEFAGGMNHSLAVTSAGRLFAWGSADSGKLGLGGGTDDVVLQVALTNLVN